MADFPLCPFKFVVHLQVEPELSTCGKIMAEAKCRVCGDSSFPKNNLVDSPGWDGDLHGQAILRDAKGNEKLHRKDLAGVERRKCVWPYLIAPYRW